MDTAHAQTTAVCVSNHVQILRMENIVKLVYPAIMDIRWTVEIVLVSKNHNVSFSLFKFWNFYFPQVGFYVAIAKIGGVIVVLSARSDILHLLSSSNWR